MHRLDKGGVHLRSRATAQLLAFLMGASAAAAIGCESKQCTEMGCVNGVDIRALHEPATELQGTYRVEVVGDGVSRACDLSIPGQAQCSAGDVLFASVSPDHGAVITIHLEDTPKALTVKVSRGAELLGETQLTPTYIDQHVDNGGEGCDLDCSYGGSHELVLVSP